MINSNNNMFKNVNGCSIKIGSIKLYIYIYKHNSDFNKFYIGSTNNILDKDIKTFLNFIILLINMIKIISIFVFYIDTFNINSKMN